MSQKLNQIERTYSIRKRQIVQLDCGSDDSFLSQDESKCSTHISVHRLSFPAASAKDLSVEDTTSHPRKTAGELLFERQSTSKSIQTSTPPAATLENLEKQFFQKSNDSARRSSVLGFLNHFSFLNCCGTSR